MSKQSHKKQNNIQRNTKSKVSIILAIVPTHKDNLELKQNLSSIEILFHKGLYHEALKLISKAEELAKECENFQLMIDILIWKKKCSGYSLGLKKAAEVNLEIDKYILLLNNFKRIR